jgi:serine protease SohB
VTAFFLQYGLFLAKTVTILVGIIIVVTFIFSLSERTRHRGRERLEVKKLNQKFEDMAHALQLEMLSKDALKQALKHEKRQHKEDKKKQKKLTGKGEHKKRTFVLNFDGDIKASATSALREEITAVLSVATPQDEVFVRLNSGGGLVHAYGLAASQLSRVRQREIPLTVGVDKVAASGGYLMACVANRIIAAPFAALGSIGVLAQIPNFHRLLKKSNIDYEMFTAGEFKRTVTMFGENTDSARAKFREELEDTHTLFKNFVTEHRPELDINRVATGEVWHGIRALELNLVDELKTSDDYLMEQSQTSDVFEISYIAKKHFGWRLHSAMEQALERFFYSWWQRSEQSRLP